MRRRRQPCSDPTQRRTPTPAGADGSKLEAAAAAGGKAAASKGVARSDSVLLVKNLPYSASEAELEALFGAMGARGAGRGRAAGAAHACRGCGLLAARPSQQRLLHRRLLAAHCCAAACACAGPLGRLVLPTTRTLALVEFLEPQVSWEARAAWPAG